MAENLAAGLAGEHAQAVRVLLASPVLDATSDPDGFRLVARHRHGLVEWFESACGWTLHVDVAAGFARLLKRASVIDTSRPLRRVRGESRAPFDRRRYQLLCLVCAELVRHPVTTMGLLAAAIATEAGLDTARRPERAAFVDGVLVLITWGALRSSGGEVEAFVDDAHGNAILSADTARLHRLLASAAAPSSLPEDLGPVEAIDALLAEPRYGDAAPASVVDDRAEPRSVDDEQQRRRMRHLLARRLLDDPVVHYDELSEVELDYVANPSGRRWLRARVAEAGFELEERVEGLLAVDPDAIATDRYFPGPHGNAHQLALLFIDRLCGDGRLGSLSPVELRAEVDTVLARFPRWAASHRDGDGPDRLAGEAIALLAGFGLVRRQPDGTVVARPAIARYRVGEPRHVAPAPPTLL
jgi:uncharacterized protein (TIGR02678 family)